jgi:hypothetical protein
MEANEALSMIIKQTSGAEVDVAPIQASSGSGSSNSIQISGGSLESSVYIDVKTTIQSSNMQVTLDPGDAFISQRPFVLNGAGKPVYVAQKQFYCPHSTSGNGNIRTLAKVSSITENPVLVTSNTSGSNTSTGTYGTISYWPWRNKYSGGGTGQRWPWETTTFIDENGVTQTVLTEEIFTLDAASDGALYDFSFGGALGPDIVPYDTSNTPSNTSSAAIGTRIQASVLIVNVSDRSDYAIVNVDVSGNVEYGCYEYNGTSSGTRRTSGTCSVGFKVGLGAINANKKVEVSCIGWIVTLMDHIPA